MPRQEQSFIDLVQQHERAWGNDGYPQRPSLADLLNAPVVVWWHKTSGDDDRLMASIHDDLEMVNKYAMRMLLHSRVAVPEMRLAMIYVNQRKAEIRSVTIQVLIPDYDA